MDAASHERDERLPIALCLEKLGATPDERYTRCTARSGRLAGLSIGLDGTILWCAPRPVVCELWVSRDQRLVALRPMGAPEVRIVRSRRDVVVPEEQPAVLRHLDEILIQGTRYRVHVHGTTTEVQPPRRILTLPRVVTLAATIATGIACGGNLDGRGKVVVADGGADSSEPSLRGDDEDASVTVVDAADASDGDVIEIRPLPPL
jgi:hypothetical protein